MLALDDPRWRELLGGYKVPYDASGALRRLERGDDAWKELWEELHHQGDLGEASYAAVPQLVRIGTGLPRRDWHFYGLLALVEFERHRPSNPPVPDWLELDYRRAWVDVLDIALVDLRQIDVSRDADSFREILAVISLAKGFLALGAMLTILDDSEVTQYLDVRRSWSTYRRPPSA
jgi:hypothetical protein